MSGEEKTIESATAESATDPVAAESTIDSAPADASSGKGLASRLRGLFRGKPKLTAAAWVAACAIVCAAGVGSAAAAGSTSVGTSATNSGDSPVFVNESVPGSLTINKTAADGDSTDFTFKVVFNTPAGKSITGDWSYSSLSGNVLSGTINVSDVAPGETLAAAISPTDTGTLTAAAPLSYEWHKVSADGDDDIVGTDSSTYTTSDSDVGSTFYVIARDADGAYLGWVKSNEAACKTPTTVKYAVQLLGIKADTTESGNTAGLTFGPATGANYATTEKASCGSEHCIHTDDWATIAEYASSDPTVYSKCLTNGCTATVELDFDGKTIGDGTYSQATGDGYGALYECIGEVYKKWNSDYYNTGGWKASQIRAVLNGKSSDTGSYANYAVDSSESLFSCFPSVLQSKIVSKAVEARTTYDSSSSVTTTYDKLWLLSYSEMATTNSATGMYASPLNEGKQYTRFANLGVTDISTSSNANENVVVYSDYTSTGSVYGWWLRSASAGHLYSSINVLSNGYTSANNSDNPVALAPCFCLGEYEEPSDVKYAVQLLGIQADTSNGSTVGLTFGPATGGDYTSKNKASCGSTHCIHTDSWATIISLASSNPHAYDSCLTNGCTATVVLDMNDTIGSGTYYNMSGDGAGALYYAIKDVYRVWNGSSSYYQNAGGWRASFIRRTLNGSDACDTADGSSTLSSGTQGADVLTTSQALISCFPEELRNAIVAKDVKTRTTYNSDSSVVTTKDKLWLLSGSEIYTSHSQSQGLGAITGEGNQYDKFKNAGVTDGYTAGQLSGTPLVAYDATNSYGSSNSCFWWLRSMNAISSMSALQVSNGSVNSYYVDNNTRGLSPCFCLG